MIVEGKMSRRRLKLDGLASPNGHGAAGNASEQAGCRQRGWRTDVRERMADGVELVRRRAEVLNPSDRALLALYLEQGGRLADIARVAGVSEGVMSRRIRRLQRRLIEGRYIACLRCRDRLTAGQLAVARDHYLDGLGIAKIAAKRGLTTYRVRQTIRKIEKITSKHDAIFSKKGGSEGSKQRANRGVTGGQQGCNRGVTGG